MPSIRIVCFDRISPRLCRCSLALRAVRPLHWRSPSARTENLCRTRATRRTRVSATRRWRRRRLLAYLAVDGVRVALAGATTDNQKFADARRVGPRLITIDATLPDWSSTPNGEYRILHRGTSDGVCQPGSPRLPHEEPRWESSRRTEFEEMTTYQANRREVVFDINDPACSAAFERCLGRTVAHSFRDVATLTVEAARQRLSSDNTARKGHADETERQRWMLSRLGRTTTQITPGVRRSNGNLKYGPGHARYVGAGSGWGVPTSQC